MEATTSSLKDARAVAKECVGIGPGGMDSRPVEIGPPKSARKLPLDQFESYFDEHDVEIPTCRDTGTLEVDAVAAIADIITYDREQNPDSRVETLLQMAKRTANLPCVCADEMACAPCDAQGTLGALGVDWEE